MLIEVTCDPAVKTVTDGGQNEYRDRPAGLAQHNRSQNHRYQQQAQLS